MRYWKVGNSVESYSHNRDIPGAQEITRDEFNAFIAALPVPEPDTTPSLLKRIEAIEAQLNISYRPSTLTKALNWVKVNTVGRLTT